MLGMRESCAYNGCTEQHVHRQQHAWHCRLQSILNNRPAVAPVNAATLDPSCALRAVNLFT